MVYLEAENDIYLEKKNTITAKLFSLRLTSSNFMSISSVDCSSWNYKLPIASCIKKSKFWKTKDGLFCESSRIDL